jgi:molecular chaperone DnaK (HSP70)
MTRRFLIGIDLGTTNSAVAYVDTRGGDTRVRLFEVPQLVAPGEVAPRRQLPSFVYLAGEHDLGPAETALPWNAGARQVVGELARTQGARNPARMVASAKSWLCHPGVDRQAAILPWGESEGPKLSPVAAQAAVLAHVREAWDAAFAGDAGARFVDQDVVVTVPASFDEAARELTLQAADKAGYPPVVLLEEPQAAFYAWIDAAGAGRAPARGEAEGDLGEAGRGLPRHRPIDKRSLGLPSARLRAGERVLVFDVGGGTTDFTLITVDGDGDGFARTAVGDHLLLGGDNVDLTLAKIVEQRLVARSEKKLDALQWHGLVHACRLAKETLLGDDAPASVPIVVAGRGSRLIGGTLRDELAKAEIEQVLYDGFFPLVDAGAGPQRVRGGLQEFGLPYAADPAVTRHLASFLGRHPGGRVDAVLFNGGAMTPPGLRQRVLDQLAAWQGSAPRQLEAALPEMAVAQGAAYYGLVRRGQATRIKGGTARAFYVGVAGAHGEKRAVCVAPKGLDEGSAIELARDFALVTNRPVSFRLYSSTSRDDATGAVVPVGDGLPETVDDGSDLLELPPIVTVLRARGRGEVTVRIEVRITELGALELHCVDHAGQAAGAMDHRWKLAFDMRSGGAQPAPASDDDARPHPRIDEARARVVAAFRGPTQGLAPLVKDLEALLEARRDEWSMNSARALFDALAEVAAERKKSADHEQRWLNLAGFCLRPGTGAPLDAWRSRQMWGVFHENLAFPKSETGRLAWWIAWRRVSGGLSKGQQEQIIDRLGPLLLPGKLQQKRLAEVRPSKQEVAEMWRTVASLERLPVALKIKLGDELAARLASRKGREDALHVWALARVGARTPLYGPLDAVVPATKAAAWLAPLVALGADDWPEPDKAVLPLAQLGRRTGDRTRDIDDGLRAALAARLRELPGGDRAAALVEQVIALEAREERVALGDTLPAGLRLVGDDEAAASSAPAPN